MQLEFSLKTVYFPGVYLFSYLGDYLVTESEAVFRMCALIHYTHSGCSADLLSSLSVQLSLLHYSFWKLQPLSHLGCPGLSAPPPHIRKSAGFQWFPSPYNSLKTLSSQPVRVVIRLSFFFFFNLKFCNISDALFYNLLFNMFIFIWGEGVISVGSC